MKFLADKGISPKTVAFLRDLGYDATHLNEQGLHRLSDPEILEKARQEERILLAHDLGFGELVAAGGRRLPSGISFRLWNMQPDRVSRQVPGFFSGSRLAGERGGEVLGNKQAANARRWVLAEDSSIWSTPFFNNRICRGFLTESRFVITMWLSSEVYYGSQNSDYSDWKFTGHPHSQTHS